jgi:hypothetical protein
MTPKNEKDASDANGYRQKRHPTGNQCLCSACGLMFTGESSFDEHRTGQYAGPTKENSRRCLTPAELTKIGKLVYDAGRDIWRWAKTRPPGDLSASV